MMMMMMMT